MWDEIFIFYKEVSDNEVSRFIKKIESKDSIIFGKFSNFNWCLNEIFKRAL